ncbi:uncharacterized protein LOC143287206 [Babylonia areolata]|uniref:uncharacterized protein LOC143287206 n=1 Tax=Babylonia areolata TaxID=304850 RepID=UPI003FD27BA3
MDWIHIYNTNQIHIYNTNQIHIYNTNQIHIYNTNQIHIYNTSQVHIHLQGHRSTPKKSPILRDGSECDQDNDSILFSLTGDFIFNLRRLLAHTKTTEELILELLFADDCALLAHTEESLQLVVNHFADAARAFGFTISLKKTEVMYQEPLHGTYAPPKIYIDGHQLNAVEHFTYLGSIISNDATISKDVDHRLSKSSSSFGRLQKRVWQNHSLRLLTKIQVYRAFVISTLLYGSEAWVLYRRHFKLLERFHQRCERFIMGINWQDYTTNIERTRNESDVGAMPFELC